MRIARCPACLPALLEGEVQAWTHKILFLSNYQKLLSDFDFFPNRNTFAPLIHFFNILKN